MLDFPRWCRTKTVETPVFSPLVFSFSRLLRLGGALFTLLGCSHETTALIPPSTLRDLTAAGSSAVVGSTLLPAPTFVATSAGGQPVAGARVTVVVSEGDGTLKNVPSRTVAGPTSIGQWTLGTRSGRNAVTVTVAGLPPLVIAVTGTPGPVASLRVAEGGGQSGFAGDELSNPHALLARDSFGNPVPGVPITLTLLSGGGTLSPTAATTDADGLMTGISWRLGSHGKPQTARANTGAITVDLSATIRSEFQITVRFITQPSSLEQQQAFFDAAERIRAGVVGDLTDVPLTNVDLSPCGVSGPVLNESVDDMIIFANVTPIDGPGRVLAHAGPCLVRASTFSTVIGVMEFDAADVPALVTNGRFEAVVTHEMLHIVGIGSLWALKGFVTGHGTSDPEYNAPVAVQHCGLLGLPALCGLGVPLENIGGAGTAEVHWRESVFDQELMTGFSELSGDMPLSELTLGGLEDLGYAINYKAADPFSLAAAALRPFGRSATPPAEPWEVLVPPVGVVGRTGLVFPLRKP